MKSFSGVAHGFVVFVFGYRPNDILFDFDAFYGEFAIDLADSYFVVWGSKLLSIINKSLSVIPAFS
jgi:hypothetical protein